ncbi:ABC transporter permease [Kaistia algarum]|uniref:ABC transporter permease n=1 Tax=Kaistia algarum TaxID=2083279 RepID=UPI000CE9330C|nr:ABC transporter permease [Kaistia algarum]MCX5515775.1 ABC transporter permease [Kaistia algarum]PPE80850.1 ABC transporter permease [Kaistia algarum]
MITGDKATDALDATTVARSSTQADSLLGRVVTSPQFMVVVVMLLFIAFGATQSAQFLNPATWINILRNAVFIAIVASFTTFVFVSGGLDLSVGSLFAVGGMASAGFLIAGMPIPVAILLGTVAGGAAGLLNGVLINYANIPPFITTLGMLYAARSLVVYFTGGQPITGLPDAFSDIARANLFGLPMLLYYAAFIVVLAHILLATTTFGGDVRAIGGNREAASNAGINVKRISTIVYVMSGLSAALAGVLMSARLGSGQPSIGVSFELQVISAVIIGGTSLFGGIGTVWGSLLGSLVLSILTTGLILLRIDPVLQDFVIGVIIVVAVGIDQLRRRRMFRSAGVR